MQSIILYTLSTCPTCQKAREGLKAEGIQFEERVIDDSVQFQSEVEQLSNQFTVPVLVHPDGRVEVGYKGEYG
ncbi:MAG TPA: glutaredoxin family protein [Symbiobacteriaceae bacterium]|nr:glutaredoxin family protein [Symbiobacteriaceae bacterium]